MSKKQDNTFIHIIISNQPQFLATFSINQKSNVGGGWEYLICHLKNKINYFPHWWLKKVFAMSSKNQKIFLNFLQHSPPPPPFVQYTDTDIMRISGNSKSLVQKQSLAQFTKLKKKKKKEKRKKSVNTAVMLFMFCVVLLRSAFFFKFCMFGYCG